MAMLTGGDWIPLDGHEREMRAVARIPGQFTRTIRRATAAKVRPRPNTHERPGGPRADRRPWGICVSRPIGYDCGSGRVATH